MSQRVKEVNFDGIVGPTHHHGGLSGGNLASAAHGRTSSFPQKAALQGLRKMKLLLDLGLDQGVFPPLERPDIVALRRLRFEGSDTDVLMLAHRKAPVLLASCSSASSMWAANAATISPSADTADKKMHITTANLTSQFHRSIEAAPMRRILKLIFRDESLFIHHRPLPACSMFGDEGAANHTRLCRTHSGPGVELFVYGRRAIDRPMNVPLRFQARQTEEASRAVARLHRMSPERTVFARQSVEAINAGAFHNDVIAVGNEDVFMFHAQAFSNSAALIDELERKFAEIANVGPTLIEISPECLSLAEGIKTYFFNSQLVSLPEGGMCLIAPSECEESPAAREVLREIEERNNPVRSVRFVNIRQSMKNGGGPACLRIRVAMSEVELAAVHAGVIFTKFLYEKLAGWVECRYRDRLHPDDLADPQLLKESRVALDELTQILRLGSIYSFQTEGG